MSHDLVVRHFRQIVLWPLQLMPVHAGQIQRHWEVLDKLGASSPWREVADEFCADPGEFQERHYREFVTFLPYAQRFLYGSSVGQEASRHDGEPSLHVYRRRDIRQVRIVLAPGHPAWTFDVAHVDLYFFLDADILALAFEMHADDLPLDVAQDVLFRFGRAYPGFWHASGEGGNCPHRVEWIDADGRVLSVSDYAERAKYLGFVGRHRAPCIAAHWDFLLRPLVLEYPGQVGELRYRQLEYYRMPLLAYLALDEPRRLSRADWVRLGLVTRPGGGDDLPYSERSLADFESEYCEDRYWHRDGSRSSADTRILVTGQTLSMVGAHGDPFFSGAENGLLSQFRHQFFLLFLVAHFHKAALLSMSDELTVALDRLTIGDAESTRAFKRTIRQVMEVFLRFSHRYWFHELSAQDLAQRVFHRLRKHLDCESLYEEVRSEVIDMNDYLDSDSFRRQANTVVRLTVVTILGLIGTVTTGFLGMNLIDETDEPLWWRFVFFAVILVATVALTTLTVARSKRLADFLDVLSDERIGWAAKLRALRRIV
jgi:hypothetical protein